MFQKALRAAVAGAALVLATGAAAQDFPTKYITVVMPFSAGGPGDTLARIIGGSLTKTLKQQVIIENAAGAGGTIGTAKVAKATPDGYTLLMIHVSRSA